MQTDDLTKDMTTMKTELDGLKNDLNNLKINYQKTIEAVYRLQHLEEKTNDLMRRHDENEIKVQELNGKHQTDVGV